MSYINKTCSSGPPQQYLLLALLIYSFTVEGNNWLYYPSWLSTVLIANSCTSYIDKGCFFKLPFFFLHRQHFLHSAWGLLFHRLFNRKVQSASRFLNLTWSLPPFSNGSKNLAACLLAWYIYIYWSTQWNFPWKVFAKKGKGLWTIGPMGSAPWRLPTARGSELQSETWKQAMLNW